MHIVHNLDWKLIFSCLPILTDFLYTQNQFIPGVVVADVVVGGISAATGGLDDPSPVGTASLLS